MILEVFQALGMMREVVERLKRRVRKDIPCGPRCFSITLLVPSGPIALEFFVRLRAANVLLSSKRGEWAAEWGPFLWRWRIRWRISLLAWGGCSVNCRLKLFAALLGAETGEPLKLMELLGVALDGFFRPFRIFQRFLEEPFREDD